jgi:hypothetical protein
VAIGMALAAIAVGVVAFVATQPGIRDAPQTAERWLWQAGAAALASGLARVMALVVTGTFA